MRPATLSVFVFVVSGFAANAQLTILPQIGLENTRTAIHYNNVKTFAPLGAQSTPNIAIRADYKFKKQHGPFAAVSTSRSIAEFNFAETPSGTKFYQTQVGHYQVRLEGGYQYSTRPIYFNKKKLAEANKKTASIQYTKVYSTRCGRTYIKVQPAPVQAVQSKDKGWHMRIQPAVGAAFMPAVASDIIAKQAGGQTNYEYRAGNWRTAILAGTGFEFGKNDQRKFVVSFQYLKGLGNLNSTIIRNQNAVKETISTVSSDVSGWNVKAGVPINLAKKKPVVKIVAPEKPVYQKRCERYSRCGKVSI